MQPNRVHIPPESGAVIAAVLAHFPEGATYDRYYASLSRLIPGVTYKFHQDPQKPGWITRVHVPIVTNPDAWMFFEGEDPVHFEAGFAYSFDTLRMHNYGNFGTEDRVHLLFDVRAA